MNSQLLDFDRLILVLFAVLPFRISIVSLPVLGGINHYYRQAA